MAYEFKNADLEQIKLAVENSGARIGKDESKYGVNLFFEDNNFVPIDGSNDYANIPRVCINSKGVMFRAFKLSVSHTINYTGGVCIMRSYDKGLNWEYIGGGASVHYVFPCTGSRDVRNPAIFIGNNDRLFCINMVYTSGGYLDSELYYSDDNGDTWSNVYYLQKSLAGTKYVAGYSERCFFGANDELIYPYYGDYDTGNSVKTALMRSTDNGETWDVDWKTILDNRLESNQKTTENVAVTLSDGIFCILNRYTHSANPDGKYTPIMFLSYDYGETWGVGGAESMTYADIETTNKSSFMYLNGDGVTMQNVASSSSACMPDGTSINIGGVDYLLIPFWIRNDGVRSRQLRLNFAPVRELIANGFQSAVMNTSILLYQQVDPYANHGGNASCIAMDGALYINVGYNVSGSGSHAIREMILTEDYLLELVTNN